MNPLLTVLSFGAGQDSTALLYKYVYDNEFRSRFCPNDFLVVMSSTNDEHDHTLEHLNNIKKFCFDKKISLVHLTPEMNYHPESWRYGLRYHYRKYNTIMSKAMRNKSCTSGLKIQPFYNFLADYVNKIYLNNMSRPQSKVSLKEFAQRYGKIRVLLGIAYDEKDRIALNSDSEPKWMKLAIEKEYPLIHMRMDRSDCQQSIASYGHTVPFPSNCRLCPFLSPIELVWMHRFNPNDFIEWQKYELAKIEKFKRQQESRNAKNYGVWGEQLLDQVLQKALDKYGHLTDDQLMEYKFSHGHCVKSKY